MGDFNSLKMDSHLPHYKQFVTFPTRDDKILDMFYCNVKDSYSAYKKAPLGASDHNMIHLLPKYRQIIKREKPTEVDENPFLNYWNRPLQSLLPLGVFPRQS